MDNSNWDDRPREERLESPFIDEELFLQERFQEWEHLVTRLEAETPFGRAFEHAPGTASYAEMLDPEVRARETGTARELEGDNSIAGERFAFEEQDLAANVFDLGGGEQELEGRSAGEEPKEEIALEYDTPPLTQAISDAVDQKDWPRVLELAIQIGWHDENQLTNLLFFSRHPELDRRKLEPKKNKEDQKLAKEWSQTLVKEVRPAIQKAAKDSNLEVSGRFVTERDQQFLGEKGRKFKEIVAWASKEVDLDSGFLAAVLLAEVGNTSPYLSPGEVKSFLTGTDDFFAQRAQLRANVPAFVQVRFDERKKTTNINEHGREVTTIPYKTGKDAALATAVYLKYGEIKLRRAAQKNSGDFDALPVATRFVLVRIAMTAGHGGISPDGDLIRFKKKASRLVRAEPGETGGILLGVARSLDRVLKGEDILVRNWEPRKDPTNDSHITHRNATILASQAMHLGNWFFRAQSLGVQPELESFETWDQESQEDYDLELQSALSEARSRGLDDYFFSGELLDDLSSAEALDSEDIDSELNLAEEENELPHELEEWGELEGQQQFEASVPFSIEEETAEGLTKKLKYLSLLSHTVEVNGKDAPLTPSVMDPGIYDGPVKYKVAPQLQECLMGVMNKHEFRHIKITLVDLTKDVTKPEFAGYNHKAQVYIASIAKLIPMLAAFQLRHDLRVALNLRKSSTLAELYSAVRDDWAASQVDPKGPATPLTLGVSSRGKLVLVRGSLISLGNPKAPILENIFAEITAGSPLAIEFKSTGENKDQLRALVDEYHRALGKVSQAEQALHDARDNPTRKHAASQQLASARQEFREARRKLDALGFLERMRIMVGGDVPVSNYITFTVVGELGYLYMASTLLQSGLYDTNRKGGLWLGARYGGSAWRGALAGGTPQSSTAGALAAFMTLLMQDRLVNKEASKEMREMMQKPNLNAPGTGSWFKNSLIQLPNGGNIKVLLCKVGLYKGADECTFIEREVLDQSGQSVRLRYVAVGLRAKHSNELKSLILELDKCILANNGLTPAQGGHP